MRDSPVQVVNGKASWVQVAGDQYMAIGTDRNDKKFRIVSVSWRHIEGINVWRGRKYLVRKGKRYLISKIWN